MHLIENSKTRNIGLVFALIGSAVLFFDAIWNCIFSDASVFGYLGYPAGAFLLASALMFKFGKNEQFWLSFGATIIPLTMSMLFIYIACMPRYDLGIIIISAILSVYSFVIAVFTLLFGMEVFRKVAPIALMCTILIVLTIGLSVYILVMNLFMIGGSTFVLAVPTLSIFIVSFSLVSTISYVRNFEGEDRFIY